MLRRVEVFEGGGGGGGERGGRGGEGKGEGGGEGVILRLVSTPHMGKRKMDQTRFFKSSFQSNHGVGLTHKD